MDGDPTEKPEIPDPQAAPDKPDPTANGSAPGNPEQAVFLDNEKLIQWMKATDKQIRLLTLGQVAVSAAVLFLLFTATKGAAVPKP